MAVRLPGKLRASTLYSWIVLIYRLRATVMRFSVPSSCTRRSEKAWLAAFQERERLDAVISDNRYGLHKEGLYSVFITHQLRIRTPFGRVADSILQGLQYRMLRKFSVCWVPDLEKKEAHIDHMEAHALKDGTVTTQEADRIKAAQNKTSAAIYNQKHDAQKGNPDSVSSMRMQEDVQRNVNQQTRIEKGVSSGALTNHEAAKLERGQAHVSRREARAGADGHVSTDEQNKIQRADDRQSRRIHHEKHDKQTKS